MTGRILLAGYLVLAVVTALVSARGPQQVTCGSVVKLLNANHKIRLHSHDVKYGSGSGQQSVTGTPQQEDVNSHWTIKGPEEYDYCKRGEPVACGQKLRLEHLTTNRNLHSHHFSSPLTNQQEVSAFGEVGEGDTGDVWTVVCEGDYWQRDEAVMFKHVDTGVYLGASGQTFGRPINGQMEIIGMTKADGSTKWRTQEGVYVHPSDFNPKRNQGSHDEL
jgi:dolichyl-phosphate-mannose--protein O-mannosyl transferase